MEQSRSRKQQQGKEEEQDSSDQEFDEEETKSEDSDSAEEDSNSDDETADKLIEVFTSKSAPDNEVDRAFRDVIDQGHLSPRVHTASRGGRTNRGGRGGKGGKSSGQSIVNQSQSKVTPKQFFYD
ncbi:hypothetical protein K7X08_033640 [Anisodus acutangulus]|uniref:Uncharacterized protein n=1 Tax=Anisodus acutangulus TaxID=402998 RepID=A0A9Q1RCS7_9SOLA|nr:hypothetical protein K7X08_033640 [Anisodus acutangulus]